MNYSPGRSVARSEDKRLLTGKGRYADDVLLARQSYAAIVRSPHAHATISGIDVGEALGAPGVLAVLTGEDWEADGLGGLFAPGYGIDEETGPLRRPDGERYANPLRKPLPRDKVVYVGQAVAIVVAESTAQAVDAAELVAVDYEPLPAAISLEQAMLPGAPLVREEIPRNIIFVQDFGDPAATDAAFRAAPHVISRRLLVSRVHANPMEPRAINAQYDADRDHFTVWGGTQSAFALREVLADYVFGISQDHVDIVPGDLGGSFGLKDAIPVEMALLPWAARRLGRPVKWTASRSEMVVADCHGRDMVANAQIAFDNDGRILALRSRNLSNIGAFVEYWGIASAVANVGGTVGPYTIPTAHVEVTGLLTHSSPIVPYRGAGRPEAAFIVESMIDLAAAELGLDPVVMRRRNLIPPDSMPYRTPLAFTYDCGEFATVLERAVEAADYGGFAARRATSEARGRLRGIGVAMCIESSAVPGTENVELTFDADGKATVLAGSTNHGQGHETVFIQYVSGLLGIDPEQIEVVESDTRVVRAGAGTGGSRSAAFNAAAVSIAIEKCIASARPVAARLLQAAETALRFSDGFFTAVGSDGRVSFTEVARAANDLGGGGIREMGEARIDAIAFPNGCQVSEVEIDPETGAVDVVSHVVCDDVGFELNPLLVKGQLMGGILQGAGQILMEQIVLDTEGQVLTGSFMDYAMPRFTDFPRYTVLSHPVPTKANSQGVKGVGESGTSGALPAVMNAVNNALASRGLGPMDMPATPSRIWKTLNAGC